MKKTYKLSGLDCANCASKMEAAILKIDGVVCAAVNFMTQKLMLEAEDGKFYAALTAAAKAIKKVEPGCKILC